MRTFSKCQEELSDLVRWKKFGKISAFLAQQKEYSTARLFSGIRANDRDLFIAAFYLDDVGISQKIIQGYGKKIWLDAEAFRWLIPRAFLKNKTRLFLQHYDVTKRHPRDGKTALHDACLEGKNDSLDIADWLFENGADINARDTAGYTPLHCVVNSIYSWENREERYPCTATKMASVAVRVKPDFTVLDFLLARGADMDAVTAEGKGVLQLCHAAEVTGYFLERMQTKQKADTAFIMAQLSRLTLCLNPPQEEVKQETEILPAKQGNPCPEAPFSWGEADTCSVAGEGYQIKKQVF